MLEDLLIPDLLVVFCGTAAGTRSAAIKQYYAGHGNRFWEVLATTKLTPRLLQPSDYMLLPQFGIGLTDIVKGQAGNDVDIAFHSADGGSLRDKLVRYKPRYLCFNGKRAAQEFFRTKRIRYGVQEGSIGPTVLFVAPSTSGMARGSWDARVWRQLARLVRAANTEPDRHACSRPSKSS
jgi:TDG/mug DNA glycosylase family protein